MMRSNFAIAALISFSFLKVAIAKIEVRNLQTNKNVQESLFTAREGFVALDPMNTVYGFEITFKKDFPLSGTEIFVNSDQPELDLSSLKKAATEGVLKSAGGEAEHRIVSGARQTFIRNRSGGDLFVIEWKPEKTGIIVESCPEDVISLRELKDLQPKGPVGVFCRFDLSPPLITISAGKDARWLSTTLTEVSGKGERFRTFEVPAGNLSGQASGDFRLNVENQTLIYKVFVTKAGEKTTTLKIPFDKMYSLGMASLSLSLTNTSYSSSSFYYEFMGLTDYIYGPFKLGFGFFSTFALSDDPAAISSRDSKAILGYYPRASENSKFSWGVWFGHRNFDFSQDVSSSKLQSSQFGWGLDTEYRFSEKNKLLIYLDMSSLGSKVVTSHMKYGMNYKHKFVVAKKELSAGGIFESQSMTMQTSTGESRQFVLTKIGASLDF